jgi:integrase
MNSTPPIPTSTKSLWRQRYAHRHRWKRVTKFPARVVPPQRVRIYERRDHYVLQFWDPAVKGPLSARVNGDLVAALAKAREIDQRLADYRSSGQGRARMGHEQLVARYREDLERRAEAAAIAVTTVGRFRSALGHYLAFTRLPDVLARAPLANHVDRNFVLAFSAFLGSRDVAPNGRPGARRRRMRGQDFVLDAVRAMFEWAADPQRGDCLPPGFVNPFRRRAFQRRRVAADMFGEPDITVAMAGDFLAACDDYQLRLFAPLPLLGLRAAEPIFLFQEHVERDTLHVTCVKELEHTTKGLQNKRLPLLPPLLTLLHGPAAGLLYVRRAVAEGREQPQLQGASLPQIVAECTRRWQGTTSVRERLQIRQTVLDEAGALTYKHIQGEFAGVAQRLHWPTAATLKDLRHLFATCMANGGLPEHERQYLMGQSTGKAPILRYTHFNRIREHYEAAVAREMQPLVDVLVRRTPSILPNAARTPCFTDPKTALEGNPLTSADGEPGADSPVRGVLKRPARQAPRNGPRELLTLHDPAGTGCIG